MRCNAGSFLRLFLLVSVVLLNTGRARAQEVWGYSDVYYDPNYDWISAIGVTMPDYSTQYYYTAKVDISLEGTDGFGAGSTCGGYPLSCDMGGWAWAGLVATPTPGASYTVVAQHHMEIYWLYVDFEPICFPYCSTWFDALGFTYPYCSPECMADPFCYCVESTASPPTDRWWTAPMILALVYFSERWFDPTSDEEVAPGLILSAAQFIGDGSTTSFTATPLGGTGSDYAWSFSAPGGAGNNPHVSFGNPTGASTSTDGHWFAHPDSECSASTVATYSITVSAHVNGYGPFSATTSLSVDTPWNPGGEVLPPTFSSLEYTTIFSSGRYYITGTELWRESSGRQQDQNCGRFY